MYTPPHLPPEFHLALISLSIQLKDKYLSKQNYVRLYFAMKRTRFQIVRDRVSLSEL